LVLDRCAVQVGKKNRMTGETLMNQDSSRSHAIFTITIETSQRLGGGQASRGLGYPSQGSEQRAQRKQLCTGGMG
jgi:hypothetical protein